MDTHTYIRTHIRTYVHIYIYILQYFKWSPELWRPRAFVSPLREPHPTRGCHVKWGVRWVHGLTAQSIPAASPRMPVPLFRCILQVSEAVLGCLPQVIPDATWLGCWSLRSHTSTSDRCADFPKTFWSGMVSALWELLQPALSFYLFWPGYSDMPELLSW